MPLPFIGRLHAYVPSLSHGLVRVYAQGYRRLLTMAVYSTEYISIVVSFFLVGLEAIIRVLTLALR